MNPSVGGSPINPDKTQKIFLTEPHVGKLTNKQKVLIEAKSKPLTKTIGSQFIKLKFMKSIINKLKSTRQSVIKRHAPTSLIELKVDKFNPISKTKNADKANKTGNDGVLDHTQQSILIKELIKSLKGKEGTDGIFRINGMANAINSATNHIIEGKPLEVLGLGKDVHVTTGIIKSILRNNPILGEPIDFKDINQFEAWKSTLNEDQKAILTDIATLCKTIQQNASSQMTWHSLAICFSPNLFAASTTSSDDIAKLTRSTNETNAAEFILENWLPKEDAQAQVNPSDH